MKHGIACDQERITEDDPFDDPGVTFPMSSSGADIESFGPALPDQLPFGGLVFTKETLGRSFAFQNDPTA